MIGTILKDKTGQPVATESSYQPSAEVQLLTRKVKQDYELAREVQQRNYREFNNRNVLQVLDDSQKSFLSYVEPQSEDPDEYWRANTVRPLTRNKIIGIAAQLTTRTIYPNVFAQNDEDEEDRDGAEIMKSLLTWNVENSDYEMDMLFAVLQALTSPAVIVETEYAKVLQTIKQKAENGLITSKEIIDEIYSGLQTHIVPVDELLIENIYEFEIQKQRFLIRRRLISYDQAQARYGKEANFKFIKPGVLAVLDADFGRFYEVQDDAHEQLLEELIYYNRREDSEVSFLNGIVMCDPNQMMKHRDYKNRPKYPFAKGGYHPINEKRFFYFRSACDDLMHDQNLVDTMWRLTLDGTALSLIPPVATYGDEHITSAVMIPGAVHPLKNPNAKVETLLPSMNLTAGYNALAVLEKSMAESSQDTLQQGVQGQSGRTAFEIARLEANARTQLGLFGKMISRLVKDLGYLMIDDIIQHQTVGEVEEVTSGNIRLKFRSFLLPSAKEEGKTISKKIEFTDRFFGEEFNEEDFEEESFALLKKEGGMDSEKRLYQVNPEKFRKLRFMLTIEADSMLPRSEEFEKALKLEAYQLAIQNPLLDQEAITKDFLLDAIAKGKSDKYIKKQQSMMPNPMEQLAQPKTNMIEQTIQAGAGRGTLTRSRV